MYSVRHYENVKMYNCNHFKKYIQKYVRKLKEFNITSVLSIAPYANNLHLPDEMEGFKLYYTTFNEYNKLVAEVIASFDP